MRWPWTPPPTAPTDPDDVAITGGGLGGVFARITDLEAKQGVLLGQVEELQRWKADVAQYAQETSTAISALENQIADLVMAVSEGISKVERAEARIRATVKRARAELEEHGLSSPGLDAEAADLRATDGEGSRADGVPSVPAHVAAPDMAGIPGTWEQEDLALLAGG